MGSSIRWTMCKARAGPVDRVAMLRGRPEGDSDLWHSGVMLQRDAAPSKLGSTTCLVSRIFQFSSTSCARRGVRISSFVIPDPTR